MPRRDYHHGQRERDLYELELLEAAELAEREREFAVRAPIGERVYDRDPADDGYDERDLSDRLEVEGGRL